MFKGNINRTRPYLKKGNTYTITMAVGTFPMRYVGTAGEMKLSGIISSTPMFALVGSPTPQFVDWYNITYNAWLQSSLSIRRSPYAEAAKKWTIPGDGVTIEIPDEDLIY